MVADARRPARASTAGSLAQWLIQSGMSAARLTAEQHAVLQAAFRFRQQLGEDYYSTRVLSHFLLHCDAGLQVAQIARLLAISRPTASRQQGLSSKEVIQKAHHHMAGRSHGKLLPRYAGPIAEQEALLPQIDQVNAERHRLPWLDNRLLVLAVTPKGKSNPGP